MNKNKNIISILIVTLITLFISSISTFANDYFLEIKITNQDEGNWVKDSTTLDISINNTSKIEEIKVVEGDKEYSKEEIINGKGNDITKNLKGEDDSYFIEVTNNSYITIYSRDVLERESVSTYKVSNIDNEEPKVYFTVTSTEWLSKDDGLILNVYAEDEYSKIQEIVTPDGKSVKSNVLEYKINKNSDYKFIIRDNVGNQTVATYKIDNFDTTAPEININVDTTEYTKERLNLSINANDNESGIKYIKLPDGNIIYNSNFNYVVYENGIYEFETVNGVGESSKKEIEIKNIDKKAPEVKTSVTPSEWSTEKKISIQAIDDVSGILGIKLPTGELVEASSYDYKANENGLYKFTIIDKVSNETNIEIDINKIDDIYPTLDLKVEDNNGIYIIVNAIDNESGIKEIILPDGKKVTDINSRFEVKEPKTYEFRAVDIAGNETVKSIEVKVN